jgi:hypothetical protein
LEKAGIKHSVGHHNVGRGGQTSEDLAREYLRELPQKLYEQLLKIYQIDFDIFGYKTPTLKFSNR